MMAQEELCKAVSLTEQTAGRPRYFLHGHGLSQAESVSATLQVWWP
jgi:hypothetical protein